MNKNKSYVLVLCALVLSYVGCKGDSGVSNPPNGGGTRISITSISPSTLSRGAQGVRFTITGVGFTAETAVDLGAGTTVNSRSVPSSTTMELSVDVIPSAAAGTRTVVVSNSAGTARLDNGLTISDNKAPVADFFVNPTQGTIASLYTLDASASADSDGRIATYRWTISDGTSPSGMRVKKQFSQKGTFTVSLTVTDDKGGISSMQKNVTVGDNKPPIADFTISPSTGSQLTLFTFDSAQTIDPDGEIKSYSWDFGGFDDKGKTATHKFTKAGDYVITLQVKDSGGSISFATKRLTVVFFDRDQAIRDIQRTITDFFKQFDRIETLSADDIVRGFSRSPGCNGRAHEITIIENEKAIIRSAGVGFLGDPVVTSVNDTDGRAYSRNRFYGEYRDGGSYDGDATHTFTMVNEKGEWLICDFFVEK